MAYIVKRHIFKDGKAMYEDRIAYANGEYVSLDDFEIAMQKKKDEIADLRKELRESGDCITQLKHELFNVQKSADEYYNKCIDLTNQIEKLKSELETKVDFETDILVKLPFDALETANMLINATYKRKNCMTGTMYDKDVYDINDLEQIAEHLLVYCKHNKESEE